MVRFNRKLTIMACVLVTCAWFINGIVAEETNTSKFNSIVADSFKGKIVLLIVDNSNALETKSKSVAIKDAKILMIGERFFIQGVGYAPEGVDHWSKDATVGIAWESVTKYISYTPDQFKNYEEMWKNYSEN